MNDEETGISIRFIREWKERDTMEFAIEFPVADQALMLALHDDREDLTFAEKLGDALRFLKESGE